MNFFSHAVVASSRSEDPRYILGSMLPDFVSMAGLRLEKVSGDVPLERGVAFHHESDDAFHGAPIFVDLMERAREELEYEGLETGPSMAIGHVGVELLLDGWLVEQHGVIRHYRDAIDEAEHVDVLLHFAGLDRAQGSARWRRMAKRLAAAPVPESYTKPAFVADRLVMILASRPRLAVPFGKEGMVHSWARRAQPKVAKAATELFAQVERRLAGHKA